MSHLTCGFIGLGLIGGSIARAIRQTYPDSRLMAYEINQDSLNAATDDGVINTPLSSMDESLSECDYIFLCAPVSENNGNLAELKKYLSPSCILTDVGSVKTEIHKQIEAAGLSGRFIGGHPMAGSERCGYINSRALLLQNAYYILTPCKEVPEDAVSAFRELIASLGAIPLVLDFALHDYVTAAISHLPHVIAASLVNLVRDSDSEDGIMRLVAAGGFKDITRIASSSPAMWQQICLTNGSNISSLLTDYIGALAEFREQIDGRQAESLYEQFESARIYRDSFLGASSGPIKPVYGISVDIDDKTGALARIVTLLAERGISIKNIGITHNRESEDGVLKLEFYGEAALAEASGLLAAEGYAPRARS